ncbi:MAG TPA: GreA/GreB family elongation factor [Candidatus Ignatzschineria merdigallinarum]|uniref:GreA/GreB family elongation factor n=1 Tax=Candidatus Ignatzschineria merdigallinarum TaxID=2838621 RepID=A0A9D1Q6Y3_9GAMM|nr:GreA/GreB family elongation factor [Candidatus Ignatzschineria merdigallinarum]
MHKLRILKPENHADFEALCKHVYGTVFNCMMPKSYGRSGQKQYGIDLLIQKNDLNTPDNRIGIQCKHVEKLSFDNKSGDSICNEVKKADEGVEQGKINISHLIIVTSLASNADLIQKTEALSDERLEKGLFTVAIEFWNEIENHIYHDDALKKRYRNIDRFHQKVIEVAQTYFENGRYSSVVDILYEHIESNEFTQSEKINILKLLSFSYAYLLQREKAKKCIELAYQLNPDDNSVILAKLHVLSLSDDDIDLYKEFLGSLPDSSDEVFLGELEFESAVRLDIIPEFDQLSESLQNKYEVKLRYLVDANKRQDSLLFQKIYRLLSEEQQVRSEVILLRIQDSIQQQNLGLASELVKTYFNPRHKTLWMIEHIVIRDNIILTLFNVYLANQEYPNALALLEEVKHETHTLDDQLLYVYFDLAIQIKDQDLFTEGKERLKEQISNCSIDTLLRITQVSIKFKDLDLIEIIQAHISNNYSKIELDRFWLFVWLEDLESNPELFIKNIESSTLLIDPDFRILDRLVIKLKPLKDQNNELNELYERVVLGANRALGNLPNNVIFLPRVLNYFSITEQYEEAYFLLKRQPETESIRAQIYPLTIELNLLKEAKGYLTEISLKEIVDDEYLLINSLALAQRSLDWDLLEEIIRNKEKSSELSAKLWLIKLEKYEKYNRSQFLQILRNLPYKIKGENYELFAIAHLEIKYGFEEKGLYRILPVVRNNIFNSEVMMSYLMLLIKHKNLGIRKPLMVVREGTTVFYKDSMGNEYSVTIDFDGVFIDNPNFLSPKESFAKKLLSKSIGDTFDVEKLGEKDMYTIISIESIYLTLNKLVNNNMCKPNFSKDVRLMSVCLDDIENTIINPFIEMSEKREKGIYEVFETYIQWPFTLHTLTQGLGMEDKAFALIYEWPQKIKTPLYSDDFGLREDLQINPVFYDVVNQIPLRINDESVLVVDSLTFLELEKYSDFKVLDVLKAQIIVSSHTLDTFYNWRYNLQNQISEFSVGSQKGKLVRYDHNSGWLIDKFTKIINFIENYCDVFPSYGNDDSTLLENYMTMKTSSSEEQAVIRLCHEKNAVLFSLDSRLRLWVDAGFKINTIGIGSVLTYLVNEKLVDFEEAELILMSQILDNRSSIGFMDFSLYVKHMFTTQEKFVQILKHLKSYLNLVFEDREAVEYFWRYLSVELVKRLGKKPITDHIKFWLIDNIWEKAEATSLFLFRKKYLKRYAVSKDFEVDINKFQFEFLDDKMIVSYYLIS